MKTEQYDVVIIGGSYAGLAAAMALGRALRTVLVIDSGLPCNRQTPYSHNFLTNDGKAPGAIAAMARQQVEQYGTVAFLKGTAIAAAKTANGFTMGIPDGREFTAKKLVFATGIKDMMPGIPGFAECWGISVLHCPYCHGYEVKQQETGILANGDTAFELASLIFNWTKSLTVYTNGPSVLSEEQTRKLHHHGIGIVETGVEDFQHINGQIRHILFNDGSRKPVKAVYARLPFVQHSSLPQMMGCTITAEGYIQADGAQRTSVPGLFACGDNVTRMRTVANAVSMGTTTGIMVNKELIEETF